MQLQGLLSTQLPHAPSLVLQTEGLHAARGAGGDQSQWGAEARGVQSELDEIGKVRAVVERLESRMGRSNPQVGKAWLSLARMYQHAGRASAAGMAAAAEALARAQAICRQVSSGMEAPVPPACEQSFAYLMSRVAGQQDGTAKA